MTMAGALAERGDQPVGMYCPIERALAAVSTRSAMVLLREAFYGATRFDEFVSRTGLTETTTAHQLRLLEGAGLFVREPYQEPGHRSRERLRADRCWQRSDARAVRTVSVGKSTRRTALSAGDAPPRLWRRGVHRRRVRAPTPCRRR